MICFEKGELKDFIENTWDEVYYSNEVQELLEKYARDVISSTKAVNCIPESYFRGLNKDKEGHDLVDIYTENIRYDIAEAVKKGFIK